MSNIIFKSLDDLDELKKVLKDSGNKKLEDNTLPVSLGKLEVEKSFTETMKDIVFKIDMGTEAQLQVFNSEDDLEGGKEEDKVLGLTSTSKDDGFELSPQIKFDPAKAWIKYKLDTGFSVDNSIKTKIGVNLKAGTNIEMASYRMHARSEKLLDAVKDDLKSFHLVSCVGDILAMKPGEALMMVTQGSLSGGLKFNVSDLFTGNLGNLSTLLDSTEMPLVIDMKAGFNLGVEFSIKDSFRIIFSRHKDSPKNTRKVAIKKHHSSDVTGKFKAGLEITFKDQAELEKVVNSFIDSLLGKPIDEINGILDKLNLEKRLEEQEDLNEEVTDFLKQLMNRLGLNKYTEKLGNISESLKKIPGEIKDKVKSMIKNKISLGFLYEYHRVRTEQEIFEAWLSEDAIKEFHEDLLKNNLSRLTEARSDEGVSIEKFLRETTCYVKKSWGFTLGIGKWSLGSKDYKEKKWVVHENKLSHGKLVKFLGARGYQGKMFKEEFGWHFDLDAGVDEFVDEALLIPSKLDYRFYLGVTATGKITKATLNDLFDLAVLWGIIPDDDLHDMQKRLVENLGKKSINEASIHLTITPGKNLLKYLEKLSTKTVENLCVALAEAMPLWEGFHIRENRELRRSIYGELWSWYIEKEGRSFRDLAEFAEDSIRRKIKKLNLGYNSKKLASIEGDKPPEAHWPTFAGIAHMNNKTPIQVKSCAKGFEELHNTVSEDQDYNEIEKDFAKIDDFATQFHHFRALGVFFLNMAKMTPSEAPTIESSFNLKYESDGHEKLLSINQFGIEEKV